MSFLQYINFGRMREHGFKRKTQVTLQVLFFEEIGGHRNSVRVDCLGTEN